MSSQATLGKYLHFVEDAAQTEHIRSACLFFFLIGEICDLRGQKTRGSTSYKQVFLGISHSGQPKIDDHTLLLLFFISSDHYVFRLEVTVDNIFCSQLAQTHHQLPHKLFLFLY